VQLHYFTPGGSVIYRFCFERLDGEGGHQSGPRAWCFAFGWGSGPLSAITLNDKHFHQAPSKRWFNEAMHRFGGSEDQALLRAGYLLCAALLGDDEAAIGGKDGTLIRLASIWRPGWQEAVRSEVFLEERPLPGRLTSLLEERAQAVLFATVEHLEAVLVAPPPVPFDRQRIQHLLLGDDHVDSDAEYLDRVAATLEVIRQRIGAPPPTLAWGAGAPELHPDEQALEQRYRLLTFQEIVQDLRRSEGSAPYEIDMPDEALRAARAAGTGTVDDGTDKEQ
jgi:hypothetical protein